MMYTLRREAAVNRDHWERLRNPLEIYRVWVAVHERHCVTSRKRIRHVARESGCPAANIVDHTRIRQMVVRRGLKFNHVPLHEFAKLYLKV